MGLLWLAMAAMPYNGGLQGILTGIARSTDHPSRGAPLLELAGRDGGPAIAGALINLKVDTHPSVQVPNITVSVPRPPNVPLLRAFWSLLDGIWGILKGSWGVLV